MRTTSLCSIKVSHFIPIGARHEYGNNPAQKTEVGFRYQYLNVATNSQNEKLTHNTPPIALSYFIPQSFMSI
jgi:hypothetical protein